MIVPITGKVGYQITMDPTVWIFDDRKIILEEAFRTDTKKNDNDELKEAAERFDRAVSEIVKPPVNRSLTRHERENILNYSYVMPIQDFVEYAELKNDAEEAILVTENGDVPISLPQLYDCYLVFAIDGKPLTEDGPVYFLYRDGSNKENPIKGVKKIVIQ